MWFKGNIHTHTSSGDGEMNSYEVAQWYNENGYDFIAITDHNKITNLDSKEFDNFLIIKNSIEFGQWETLFHISGIGLKANNLKTTFKNHQDKIDFILKNNGVAIINHPNWKWVKCSFNKLLELQNYNGIEIFNSIIKDENGSPFATEKWDYLLSLGKKVWGFAVDDLHKPLSHLIGRGWIVVKCKDLVEKEILDSIKAGEFYSSTGVILEDYYIDNNKFYIKSLNGEEIVFIGENGKIIKVIDDKCGYIELGNMYKYIRCEVRSSEGIAFTQPIF